MVFGIGRPRREARLLEIEEFRQLRRVVREDLTVLGEQLSDLHLETLTDELSTSAQGHYQQGLDGYERAKTAFDSAENKNDIRGVEAVIVEARYQRACVLALREGIDPPERRAECFFNPHHGPARVALPWTPPMGVEREIEVCHSCRRRLDQGEDIEHRQLRVGDRYLEWWRLGSAAAAAGHDTHLAHGSTSLRTYAAMSEAYARRAASASGVGIGSGL